MRRPGGKTGPLLLRRLLPSHDRRIAISLLAGTLNSPAAFSMAAASSEASTSASHTSLLAIL
jgi:hypothetical protein